MGCSVQMQSSESSVFRRCELSHWELNETKSCWEIGIELELESNYLPY